MLVALPSDHRIANQSDVSIADLRDDPLFLISHGLTHHSLEGSLTTACERHGFAPRIAQIVPEFMLALNLVAAGPSLTFVPAYMQSIHAEKISYRRVTPGSNMMMETVLAYRAGEASPTVRNLGAVASRLFTQITWGDSCWAALLKE